MTNRKISFTFPDGVFRRSLLAFGLLFADENDEMKLRNLKQIRLASRESSFARLKPRLKICCFGFGIQRSRVAKATVGFLGLRLAAAGSVSPSCSSSELAVLLARQ